MHGIVGIGLVALDIVIDDATDERLGTWAGGSCGNVLSILSWLGWRAAPVARLDDAHNAQLVKRDLQRWDVDDRWLELAPRKAAPIFIERLRQRDDGTVSHRFERFCPVCGGRLPRYQAVPRNALGPVVDDLGAWDVVYVDRPSAGAVHLAQEARDRRMLVVYEPSARGSAAHTHALASAASVVKYSADRLTPADREVIAAAAPALEVETLGAAGLRYRRGTEDWRALPAVRVDAQDTAGAGDWTTAGLLVGLVDAETTVDRLSPPLLKNLLGFAQALGAWSCRFPGPRGAMERHRPEEAIEAATALQHGARHTARHRRARAAGPGQWACEACR